MFFILAALLAIPRERAVLIYPIEPIGFRRVFYSAHQRSLQRDLAKRFDVEVHERIGTAEELFRVDVRGAKLLILSGHGSPFAMSMRGRDERTLDASKLERMRAFFEPLAPDATIILQSCETGQGFAWIVKQAAGPGRHVIAADGEVPRDGLQIGSLDPLTVTITCARGEDCTLRL